MEKSRTAVLNVGQKIRDMTAFLRASVRLILEKATSRCDERESFKNLVLR